MLPYRERIINFIERLTFTHNVGRLFPPERWIPGSILVLAAHPDDDVLGVGLTMRRHVQAGENVSVVFATNGGGHLRLRRGISRVAAIRWNEACGALSNIGIWRDSVFCLGLPDGRLYRYMNQLALDVFTLLQRLKPSRVYVHSIEGGHRDHDITSFVVQMVCRQAGYTEVYEWAEYSSTYPLGCPRVDFLPDPLGMKYDSTELKLTSDEFALKRRMLMKHNSQAADMAFHQYETRNEAIRLSNFKCLKTKLTHFWNFDSNRLNSSLHRFEGFMNTASVARQQRLCDFGCSQGGVKS